MSAFTYSVPQSIIDYNGNNPNIPNKDQLETYFTKIRGMLDFIRIFLIVNYSYIDNIPVRNMFKLLYVPLDTDTTEPHSKKRKTSSKTEEQEPTYISINCEIDFKKMFISNTRIIKFHEDVYFRAVSNLNDVVKVDSLYDKYLKKNTLIGEFSLENLNKTYCLYYFKNNINFPIEQDDPMSTNYQIYANICYKYFEDKTLQAIIDTINNNVYTCSVLELNKSFFDNLPKLQKNISLEHFTEDTIDSYIFKNSDDRYIKLLPKPIELQAIPDTAFGYVENPKITNSIVEEKIPFAEEPANKLYNTVYPNRGVVFAFLPELYVNDSRLERPAKIPKRGGGTKHKKQKNRKTKNAKKSKKKH